MPPGPDVQVAKLQIHDLGTPGPSGHYHGQGALHAVLSRIVACQPSSSFVQMAKLGVALVKGRTGLPAAAPAESAQADNNQHVAPQQFKFLVGKGHSEFGSSRQQVTHLALTYLWPLSGTSAMSATYHASNR